MSFQNAEGYLKEAKKYAKRSGSAVIMRRIDERFNDAVQSALRVPTMRNGYLNPTATNEILRLRERYNKILGR